MVILLSTNVLNLHVAYVFIACLAIKNIVYEDYYFTKLLLLNHS